MKPTLYWTIVKSPYWQGRYELMRVTSERNAAGHKPAIFGSRDGRPTHARPQDCHGRFPTPEAAAALLGEVQAIFDRSRERLNVLHRRIAEEQNATKLKVAELLKTAAAA